MIWTGKALEPYIANVVSSGVQIQPNGFDLTVLSIEEFIEPGAIDFDNSKRRVPKTSSIPKQPIQTGIGWHLMPGGYLLRYREIVTIPKEAIGIIFPRSSLMRGGAMLCSAVWDPGYSGQGLGLLQVFNPHGITLYENARVGQLVFLPAQAGASGYQGIFQNERA